MRILKKWHLVLLALFLVVAASVWYGTRSIYPRRIAMYPGHFCWAKDSSNVFYVIDGEANGPPSICRYSLKGRQTDKYEIPREAAPAGSTVLYLDVSPDGRKAIFSVGDPYGGSVQRLDMCHLYSMDLTSRKLVRLRSIPELGCIAWLSNNTVVYAGARNETWVMRPDGSGARRVTASARLDRTTDGTAFVCLDKHNGRQVYDLNGKRLHYWAPRKEDTYHYDELVYASAKRCVFLAAGGPDLVPSPCLDNRTGVITEVLVPAEEVKLSPNGAWALYRTRASTFEQIGPFGRPYLCISPLPDKTKRALEAP